MRFRFFFKCVLLVAFYCRNKYLELQAKVVDGQFVPVDLIHYTCRKSVNELLYTRLKMQGRPIIYSKLCVRMNILNTFCN